MLNFFARHFRSDTMAQVKAAELVLAEKQLLEALSQLEYYTAISEMLSKRVVRLTQ